jgi:hypothetical protein
MNGWDGIGRDNTKVLMTSVAGDVSARRQAQNGSSSLRGPGDQREKSKELLVALWGVHPQVESLSTIASRLSRPEVLLWLVFLLAFRNPHLP